MRQAYSWFRGKGIQPAQSLLVTRGGKVWLQALIRGVTLEDFAQSIVVVIVRRIAVGVAPRECAYEPMLLVKKPRARRTRRV